MRLFIIRALVTECTELEPEGTEGFSRGEETFRLCDLWLGLSALCDND